MEKGISLTQDIRYLKGVGPKRAKEFHSLGIETVKDLFDYFPFRIDDFSRTKRIADLKPGDEVSVAGKIITTTTIPGLRGPVLRVGMSDGTGICYLVWYNMPYLARRMRRGMQVFASGKVEWRREGWEIAHPLIQENVQTGSKGPIIPIYHCKAELPSSTISRIIRENLSDYLDLVTELISDDVVARQELMGHREAYNEIHCPTHAEKWYKARRTFAFREVFLQQMALLMMKKENATTGTRSCFKDFSLPREFVDSLPFHLTTAQEKTIEDIEKDLSSGRAMNRLIQGDVGSGKTVVAIWALLAAVNNGYQGAFLVPTEVLARQHLKTIQELAGRFARIGFLSGSISASEKQAVLGSIAEGSTDVLIGTHAMLEPNVRWANLGLIVTDEQHRFGVKQRLNLSHETTAPHVLVMSATPIPRSLALTIYGDLDISVIDELPYGTNRVKTQLLEYSKRRAAYDTVRQEIEKGHQAYVVCPQISEGKSDRKSVERVFDELSKGYLQGVKVGLAHGGMSRDFLSQQMSDFAEGLIQVLIATTVVEVGIDVPNATCMVIEGAESFGLATLHQLRGRVGRAGQDAFCFLIPSHDETSSVDRLKVFETVFDGFELAELDLLQRGPGQFFGVKQHGLSSLNVEDLGITTETIEEARLEARHVMEALRQSDRVPHEFNALLNEIQSRFGDLAQHARSR